MTPNKVDMRTGLNNLYSNLSKLLKDYIAAHAQFLIIYTLFYD